jgi:hypothetical protein
MIVTIIDLVYRTVSKSSIKREVKKEGTHAQPRAHRAVPGPLTTLVLMNHWRVCAKEQNGARSQNYSTRRRRGVVYL